MKNNLTEEQRKIMLEKGTEAPFTGKWLKNNKDGTYVCAACSSSLFSSKDKFNSKTGWPSFSNASNVDLRNDFSHGTYRIEVVCIKCGGHLGHLFDDGPTGKRYCINSACLDFKEK